MLHEIIMAGFGGQGIMFMGQLLAYAGMLDGLNVSWFPSYGPEMRGGTANCSVVVSDEEIGSPVVSEPSAAIIMNKPSLDKFEGSVVSGGLLILNTSLIDKEPKRNDITVVRVQANQIADELGDLKVANMVALGALVEITGCVTVRSVEKGLTEALSGRRPELISLNMQAFERGAALAAHAGRREQVIDR